MSPGGVESEISLYESDILEFKRLTAWLNKENVGKKRNPKKYSEELVERFFKAGYHVEVRMIVLEDTETDQAISWEPQIIIEARVRPEEEFDHDRMRYEVRSDILGRNTQGNVQQKMVGQAGYSRTGSGLIVPGRGPV